MFPPRTALLFILSFVVFAASVASAPIDSHAALKAAVHFLEQRGLEQARPASSTMITADGQALAHLITLTPQGYVIVSADDDLPPVIAYSSIDSPGVDDGRNPLLDLVKTDLRNRLAALPALDPELAAQWRLGWRDARRETPEGVRGPAAREEHNQPRFTQWPPAGSTPTGGWLLSNWTQNAPYNALCPLDLAHGGSRSLAGCPAVAMAMILNYHATVQETAFDGGDRYLHNYYGNVYWIPDAADQYDFPDFATLNSHLETLSEHWEIGTPLTNTEKAALVFACGVAAQQVYAASGSGTFGVDQAYDAYQRFAFTGSRLALDSDPNLFSDLATEMQNAHPAHLAVVDAGWTSGHNLVVDGYNTDDYFHLNFGWGGSYNGWYLLPQGLPFSLTVIEGVILDILPAATSVEHSGPAAAFWELINEPNPAGLRATVSFRAPASGPVKLGIYDLTGRLEETIFDATVGQGLRTMPWSPAGLPAGVHWLRLESMGQVETRRVVVVR